MKLPTLSHLPRDTRDTLFVLAVIAWVLAPLSLQVPLWCSLLSATVIVWRAVLAWRGQPLPSRWWLLGLLLLSVVGTLISFKTILGRDAGVTLGVVLLAFVWRWADAAAGHVAPSIYTVLSARGAGFMVLACLFLCAMSVVGDLVESLVKRSAGFKDSSGLLPGHGGVLDRVDALLPTLPLAMMLVSI